MPNISEFVSAGCELSTPFNIFVAIYGISNGKPCEGCSYDLHGSSCKARKALFSTPTQAKLNQQPAETVRETAARLGISISEVRRRRRNA